MLTPEYLNLIEFNDVVNIYNQLNIDITADIIKRVSEMEYITSTTKDQMRIILQTNGADIFNETLEKTSMLSAETKKALNKIFKDMAKEDLNGYKELYEYRDKPFKLSEIQYKVLNEGLRKTNKTLKNLTNTIAFNSQQMYVEAVDKAYMKVASGAFSYDTAISTACQDLADKGITLKDKKGRNVQLEVAVRRNIMGGIQETANHLNRDIEEELGCDGYEVTAHMGARPTHAEEQGKQFALNKKDASKFKVGLWSDVEGLWEEYNCRHSYFGIILGISEPQYSKKELKEFKNAKITYNGKEIPYYEATQKQRALENNIRKSKRSVQTLEKAGLDNKVQKMDLAKLNKQYTDFCKETGLEKDYSRTKVAKTKKIIQKYEEVDITNNHQDYKIQKQNYYIADNGIKYKVDGKHVKLEPSQREIEVANMLGKIYGGKVQIIPIVAEPSNIKTPDYIINKEKYDLKEIRGNSKNTLDNAIRKQEKQAKNFVFDITNTKMDQEQAISQIHNIYNSAHREWIDKIVLIKNDKILKVYKRK